MHTTQMNCNILMLYERAQAKEKTCCMIPFIHKILGNANNSDKADQVSWGQVPGWEGVSRDHQGAGGDFWDRLRSSLPCGEFHGFIHMSKLTTISNTLPIDTPTWHCPLQDWSSEEYIIHMPPAGVRKVKSNTLGDLAAKTAATVGVGGGLLQPRSFIQPFFTFRVHCFSCPQFSSLKYSITNPTSYSHYSRTIRSGPQEVEGCWQDCRVLLPSKKESFTQFLTLATWQC